MPYRYKTFTFIFRGTEAQQNEAVSQKAEELGFNRFSRYEFGTIWRKQDGTEVVEDYFQKGNERLHIVCLNPHKKEQADAKNFQFSINHD